MLSQPAEYVVVTMGAAQDCSQLVNTKNNFISIAKQPRAGDKCLSTWKEFIILSKNKQTRPEMVLHT